MDARIMRLTTPEQCENFFKNATARGAQDLAIQARQRRLQILAEAQGAATALERDCFEAVFAYEDFLSDRNGKRTKASRTWQMINAYGVKNAVERLVTRTGEASGFSALTRIGLSSFSFEAVVLRHASSFSEAAVEQSRMRLAGAEQ